MKRLIALMFVITALFSGSVFAQGKTVSGKVVDSKGEALFAVNIGVKGTSTGTTSDMEGNYKITAPEGSTHLVFTYVGYINKEVEIGAQTTIDVTLESNDLQLDEVVVTALGIEKEKKSLGYSVQEVGGASLSESRDANMVNSMSGKVAGLQITQNSGAVGASSRVVIRGVKTLTGNNQPLFVIDGVPIDNSTNGSSNGSESTSGVDYGNAAGEINPDDIASMTVLKGANAAALYGSRGMNGVILITTKSGKNKKGMGVNLSSTVSFQNPMILPKFQNSYGQGSAGEFSYVDGAGGGVNDGVDESWGPKLDAGLMIPQFFSKGQPAPWVSTPNNVRDFFETGVTANNSVALSGGNEKVDARLSVSNSNQKGMVPNTGSNRTTVSVNAGAKLTDKLSLQVVGNYMKQDNKNFTSFGYDAQNIMQQFLWTGRQVDYSKLKEYKTATGEKYNWNYNYHNNPYFTLNENTNASTKDRVYGNAKLNYKFTDWLNLTVRSGLDSYTQRLFTKRAETDIDNKFGSYEEQVFSVSEFNSDFLFAFNKNIGTNINVNATLGGNAMYNSYTENVATAPELAIPGLYNVSNSRIPRTTTNYFRQQAINSFYGTAQVGYKNSLFMDVTLRQDWTSALSDANNQYLYPSVSLSAVVSDMLDLPEAVNFLKVRGSYAQIRNATTPLKTSQVLGYRDPWSGGATILQLSDAARLNNPNLRPEKQNSIEFGIESKFFNNRLSFEAAYYNSVTSEQILNADISDATGYDEMVINSGSLTNNGLEFQLGITPIKVEGGFQWDIMANLSRNWNKVDIENPITLSSYWGINFDVNKDYAYGSFFGKDFQRDPSGNIIHQNGLPLYANDNSYLGTTTPKWFGGVTNSFSFKGITASALIDFKQGGSVYSVTNTWGRYAGVLEETEKGREGGIVGDGVILNGDGTYRPNDVVVSAQAYNQKTYVNAIHSSSVFDASYVKFREAQIAYSLPSGLLSKTPFTKASLGIQARNLAILFKNAPHIDPETSFSNGNIQGMEFGQIPTARSIGFNINLTL